MSPVGGADTALSPVREPLLTVSGTDAETIAWLKHPRGMPRRHAGWGPARLYMPPTSTIALATQSRDVILSTTTAAISLEPVLRGQVPFSYFEQLPLFQDPTFYTTASRRRRRARRQSAVTAEVRRISAQAETALSAIALKQESSQLLTRRLSLTFAAAIDEHFEDGVASDFSRTLIGLVEAYGVAAVAHLERQLTAERVNEEVFEETLRWLAAVDHQGSYKYRLALLQRYLGSPSPRIRDAAGLGLAALDDPSAIPALEKAIATEDHAEVRQGLQQALDQLYETSRWCHPS